MDGRRNWDWHNVVDVSPYLHYESTGDSEVNSDHLNVDNSEVKNYEAADDALSCCSDSYDTSTAFNKNYGDHDKESAAQCSKKKSKEKEKYYGTCLKKKSKKKEQNLGYNGDCNDDDGDEDDGAINQVWSSCGKLGYGVSRQQKKSSNSNAFADSSLMEPKKENDKLFWDTCLDS